MDKIIHPITGEELNRPSVLVDKEGVLFKVGEWDFIEENFQIYFSTYKSTLEIYQNKNDEFYKTLKKMLGNLRAVELPRNQELLNNICNITGWVNTKEFKNNYPEIYRKINM